MATTPPYNLTQYCFGASLQETIFTSRYCNVVYVSAENEALYINVVCVDFVSFLHGSLIKTSFDIACASAVNSIDDASDFYFSLFFTGL